MEITLLKSKIHRAVITDQNLYYEGSLSIDQDLMDAVAMYPYEKLLIANTDNGQRIETYAIKAERGSGIIGLNGAAARRGMRGDSITVFAFGQYTPDEAETFKPRVIVLDEEKNKILKTNVEEDTS